MVSRDSKRLTEREIVNVCVREKEREILSDMRGVDACEANVKI
jgi:hypothetical protein